MEKRKINNMSSTLDKIKERLANLKNKGGQKQQDSVYWKPDAPKKNESNEYMVRLVPTHTDDPLRQYWIHYGMGVPGFLSPFKNFNEKEDPIQPVIRELWNQYNEVKETESFKSLDEEGRKKELAPIRGEIKKFSPSDRYYALVVVRGEEDKGARIWSFSKTVYEEILSIFSDPDVGDISDPENGYDLKVTVSNNGKTYSETKVKEAKKSSKLSSDKALSKKILDNRPNIDDEICRNGKKTLGEVENILEKFMNQGEVQELNREAEKKYKKDEVDAKLDDLLDEE